VIKNTRALVLPALAAAAVLTMRCSAFEEPDDVVYCVDESNTVVDDANCDDTATSSGGSNALYYYMLGRYSMGLPVGSQLDPSLSTARVPFNDPNARTSVGLTKSGTITTGVSASGKPGGFGTGNKPGGFGG
jgi:hypothetical protein